MRIDRSVRRGAAAEICAGLVACAPRASRSASFEDGRPQPGDLYLVAEGETPPAAARTLIIGDDGRHVHPVARRQSGADRFRPRRRRGRQRLRPRARSPAPSAPTAADPESLALLALAERVAAADITVLINGPTGTGKEVLARAIHHGLAAPRRPVRRDQLRRAARDDARGDAVRPPEGRLHRRVVGRRGLFPRGQWRHAAARRDRRDAAELQAKLLRALQEREVVPIGATDAGNDRRARHRLRQPRPAGRSRRRPVPRRPLLPPHRSSRSTTKPLAERRQDIPALAATLILRHAGNRAIVPWPTADAIDALIDA